MSCRSAVTRRVIAAAVIVIAATASSGIEPVAEAAEGDLEISADGESWDVEFPTTLFPDGLLLAPGDDASAVAFVRNAADTPGVLTIAAAGTNDWTGSDDVTIEVVVRIDDRPSAGDSRDLAALAAKPEFAIEAPLDPGAAARIDIRVRIDAAAANDLQGVPLDLDLEVRLAGDSTVVPVVPQPPGSPPSASPAPPAADGNGGILASTGARVVTTLAVAAVVLAAGVVVQHLATTRRRSSSEY